MNDSKADRLRQAVLNYHRNPEPGKLEIRATKTVTDGHNLADAYFPGVAEAWLEIKANLETANHYKSRGNLVAFLSNV